MKTGKTKNRIREGNPAVTVLLYVLVLLICIATVYPMYYVLILSISAPEYAAKMNVYLVPKGFSLGAYKMLAGNVESVFEYNPLHGSDDCSDAGYECTNRLSADV